MMYRGYVIEPTICEIPSIGKPSMLGIFDGDRRMAYVANDKEFARHVVDVKIKEGAWPQLDGEGAPK